MFVSISLADKGITEKADSTKSNVISPTNFNIGTSLKNKIPIEELLEINEEDDTMFTSPIVEEGDNMSTSKSTENKIPIEDLFQINEEDGTMSTLKSTKDEMQMLLHLWGMTTTRKVNSHNHMKMYSPSYIIPSKFIGKHTVRG